MTRSRPFVRPTDTLFLPVRPGARFGERPERRVRHASSRAEAFLQGRVAARRPGLRPFGASAALFADVRRAAEALRATDELERLRRRRALGALRTGSAMTGEHAVEVFAHVVLECEDLFGVTLHDEQLYAGWAMLHGSLVEMRTGEGKTFAAALPAVAVALGGMPVHVITANDYLAARDGEALAPLYARFGLTVGLVTEDATPSSRAEAYRRDVTYCGVKRLVFDYLEDGGESPAPRAGLGERLRPLMAATAAPPRMRGLCFALVDEADSVLVDDARTPLVLSESRGAGVALRARSVVALAVARSLHEGIDFRLAGDARTVQLSVAGCEAVDLQTRRLGGDWALARYRHELVRQALSALHRFRPDRDYLVRDGRLVLIDPSSGRAKPDHRLRHGLHQMLELKEGCEPSAESEVVATLGVQRFFGRYHRVGGMSGTLAEARGELATVYGLPVSVVPTHRPCRLTRLPDRVVADADTRLERLLERVAACRAAGRPVLIGTRTLALAETIGERLAAAGTPYRRLDARQDADEAEIIGRAGEPGAVTVATNVAGRGADIPLHPNARAAGGLHVIALELNDSARVDRQLFGRAARQGDPGSCERLLSLDDEGLEAILPTGLVKVLRPLAANVGERGWFATLPFSLARHRIAIRHRHQRLALFRHMEQDFRQLAVAGERITPP